MCWKKIPITFSQGCTWVLWYEQSHFTFQQHRFIYLYFDLEFNNCINFEHDDVIKWKHFPRYWPFVRGIHRSPMNSPHKGQWRGALVFPLICAWINRWVNNREACDLRRHQAHYDVIVMTHLVPLFRCHFVCVSHTLQFSLWWAAFRYHWQTANVWSDT